MDPERTFRELIGKVYDAGIEPDLWPACLESIAETVKASGTVLTIHDFHSQSGHLSYMARFDRSLGDKYDQYFANRNPYMLEGGAVLAPGRVLTGDMILPFAEVCKTEYYNEYFAPAGLRHMLGGTLHDENGARSILTCLRPRNKPPFGARDIKMLQLLMPHLRKAMQVHCRLAGVRLREQVLLSALDSMLVGLILLDAQGKPVLLNKSAEKIFSSNDGLGLGKNGIVASLHTQTKEIAMAVQWATRTDGGASTIVIKRPSANRPYMLLVSPVSPTAELPGQSLAVMLITDPELSSEHQPNAALLSLVFGLTPAECRLAAYLFQGRSVHQASQYLHISLNTARTHLKHLFDKTETHRQAQLLKVLSSF